MFTAQQIKEKMTEVKTGADFPALALHLKKIGITFYVTNMTDGSSNFHGANGYELATGPNYEPLIVSDIVNPEQLRKDIADHQQGKSGYLEISRQCAANGIEKWEVCLSAMTCTYVDKAGNKIWVEKIPTQAIHTPSFTVEQIKEAHGKVRTGADFPAYIKDIKTFGVTHYETYVVDGHTNYYGANGYFVNVPPKYTSLTIADAVQADEFKAGLLAHQEGKTDFLTFIKMCAVTGIAKWEISMEKMTCTYYSKVGTVILTEHIPQ